MQNHEAEIRAVFEAWCDAVRRGDRAGILARHAPDIVMFDVPLPVQAKGIAAYERTWDAFLDWFGRDGDWEVSELAIVAGAEAGYSHCLVRCAGSDPDGSRSSLDVRLTTGYRRVNGAWAITHEHHSVAAAM